MDLFIQLDDDGNPINHPMPLQSLTWFFPDFDPENPPTGYARFIRHWPPAVGPDQTYDTQYKWIDGYFQDVFTIRDLTPEEKAIRESHLKEQLQHHLETMANSAPLAIQSVQTSNNVSQYQPMSSAEQIVIKINETMISFDNRIEISSSSNGVFFYYTFPSNERVKLESISQTPLESIKDLPAFYNGNVGDFYVIKPIAAVYAWSGNEWVKVSNDPNTIPSGIENDFAQLEDWNFENNIDTNLTVDVETRKRRIDVCNICEFLSQAKTCKRCGCFMPLKTLLKDDVCPIGKW